MLVSRHREAAKGVFRLSAFIIASAEQKATAVQYLHDK